MNIPSPLVSSQLVMAYGIMIQLFIVALYSIPNEPFVIYLFPSTVLRTIKVRMQRFSSNEQICVPIHQTVDVPFF